MASSPEMEVQDVIFDTLDGAVLLNAAEVPVRDNIPDPLDMPYITFGEASNDIFDTQTSRGFTVNIDIVTFVTSTSNGRLDCGNVLFQIYTLLHRTLTDTATPNYNINWLIEDSQDIQPFNDGHTYQGTFRVTSNIGVL